MLENKKIKTNRRELIFLGCWLILKILDHVLANRVDPDSAFVASANHLYLISSNIFISILLIYFLINYKKLHYNNYIGLQLVLYLYYFCTSAWSDMLIVSAGQSVYSLINLIFGYVIAKIAITDNLEKSMLNFLIIWSKILLVEYFVKVVVIGGLFVPLDEKSLIAAVVFYGFIVINKSTIWSKFCFILIFIGNSFSAVFAAIVFWISVSRKFYGFFRKCILISILILCSYVIFLLLDAGLITIFGKSIEIMQSGSGRFGVWEALLLEISKFDFLHLLFGRGYMSERAYLTQLDLTWGIDAHSNILQIMYGTGILGVLLVSMVWLWPLTNRKFTKLTRFQPRLRSYLVAANFSLLVFGATSSHYFSRPSLSAMFMTGLIVVIHVRSVAR